MYRYSMLNIDPGKVAETAIEQNVPFLNIHKTNLSETQHIEVIYDRESGNAIKDIIQKLLSISLSR